MTFLHELLLWFNDPLNWRGPDGVPHRLGEHLALVGGALVLAVVVALPAGAWLGHRRRGAAGAVAANVANVGRAVPSIAVLVFGVIWLGGDYAPALLTLTLLALPPIFTLTYTAVRDVDPAIVDAARGMGVGPGYLLRRVELPVAWPLVLAGLRLSTAAVVATATIAALPGGGGLGRYIIHGFALRDYPEVFAGTLLVVGLVVAGELAFAALGRWTVPRGLRTKRRPGR
jgi:osmoprotectant transport system permease protein